MASRPCGIGLRLLPVLILAVTLTGCFSSGSGTGGTGSSTVTLKGRVSTTTITSLTVASDATLSQDDPEPGTGFNLVLHRVAGDGSLDPFLTGSTDHEGYYTFTGVPNRTQVVVEASITDTIKMRSTTVTDGDTTLDVDPLSHVPSEAASDLVASAIVLWKLDLSADQRATLVNGIRALYNNAVPIIGSPPPVSQWDQEILCRLPDGDELPWLVTAIECHMQHFLWAVATEPELVQAANALVEPLVPLVSLPKVSTPIPVDGSPRGWEGITPVVTNRGGSRRIPLEMQGRTTIDRYTDFRHLHMARDTEFVYTLIQFDTPLITAKSAHLGVDFLSRVDGSGENIHVFFIFDGTDPEPEPWVGRRGEYRRGSELEGIDWNIQGPYVEFTIPYAWITETAGNEPLYIHLQSSVFEAGQCDSCLPPAVWEDTLPLIRLNHR